MPAVQVSLTNFAFSSSLMLTLSVLGLMATAATATAESLAVVNRCSESVLLYTQTSFGSIANYVNVDAGAAVNMGISTDWDGAINVGMWFSVISESCRRLTSISRYGVHGRRIHLYDRRANLERRHPIQQSRIQLCECPQVAVCVWHWKV